VGKVPGHPKIPGYRDFSILRKTIESLNIEKDVLVPGYVPEKDLPMFYSAADPSVHMSPPRNHFAFTSPYGRTTTLFHLGTYERRRVLPSGEKSERLGGQRRG
jgi:hypothetical protein